MLIEASSTQIPTTSDPDGSLDDALRSAIEGAYARDDKGRFAPGVEDAPPPPEPAAEQAAETEAPIEAAPEPIAAPASWSEDARNVWASLPRNIQQEMMGREQEALRSSEQYAGKLKTLDAITEALSPAQQRIALAGTGPDQYVRSLVAADEYLRKDPINAINWLAQSYGIDLRQLAQQPAATTPTPTPEPRTDIKTQQAIASLQQELKAIHEARAQAEIDAFARDTAKHPHFEAARPVMAQLVSSGLCKTLEDAYERAIHFDPELRRTATATAAQARVAEASKKADAARKAASVNVEATTPAVESVKTLDDALRAAINKHWHK